MFAYNNTTASQYLLRNYIYTCHFLSSLNLLREENSGLHQKINSVTLLAPFPEYHHQLKARNKYENPSIHNSIQHKEQVIKEHFFLLALFPQMILAGVMKFWLIVNSSEQALVLEGEARLGYDTSCHETVSGADFERQRVKRTLEGFHDIWSA